MREAEGGLGVRLPLIELAEGTLSGVAKRDFHETGRVAARFTQMLAEGGMPTADHVTDPGAGREHHDRGQDLAPIPRETEPGA
jgi:hypothetical protein